MSAPTRLDARWNAVATRNAAFDGQFVYSVKTTGVYCRPSCAARRPRPENVAFHRSAADAERAGFRACRRCRPAGPTRTEEQAQHIAELCRWIEGRARSPSLAELARRAGVSAHHLHRTFKAVTGLTPREYAAACRAERARRALRSGTPVTQAIYAAGYGSSSRFYAGAAQRLGMKPAAYRAGGADAQIRFAVGECSLGSILVARSARGICAIQLGDDPCALVRELQDRFPSAELIGADADFERVMAQVVGFVEAPRLGLDLPLDVRGTAFQARVWRALCDIPPGQTLSYTELAERVGAPHAVRAVAGACAANRLAVAIPCHRVVRSDGALSGYRWGVERKRALLDREASS